MGGMGVRVTPWRVVDIVVAAVLGLACGLIFVTWNFLGSLWLNAMDALTPGLGGLATGIWLIGGVLGGLVIRKPGAALFVEVLAAVASMLLGSQWGVSTIYSGIAQGLGAELVFALTLYRSFRLPTAALAGVGAAAGAFLLELFTASNLAKSLEYNLIYLSCLLVSGALLAGVLGHALVGALARTGALDRFSAGREARGVA